MYGTIFRMKIIPGYEGELIALAENWNKNERFMKFRELLLEDPEWTDGEFVSG